MKDELTAIENLRVASGLAGITLSQDEAREILGRIGLGQEQYLPVRFLSAGQRRRVALRKET